MVSNKLRLKSLLISVSLFYVFNSAMACSIPAPENWTQAMREDAARIRFPAQTVDGKKVQPPHNVYSAQGEDKNAESPLQSFFSLDYQYSYELEKFTCLDDHFYWLQSKQTELKLWPKLAYWLGLGIFSILIGFLLIRKSVKIKVSENKS